MKIAVTFDSGMVFQHFGHSECFKVYTIENNVVASSELVYATEGGHGALSGLLAQHKIDKLICGGIGGGARTALAQAGIELFPGASGAADVCVEALLAGTLQFDPDTTCNHHHGDHTCGEDKHDCAGNHDCGGHHA